MGAISLLRHSRARRGTAALGSAAPWWPEGTWPRRAAPAFPEGPVLPQGAEGVCNTVLKLKRAAERLNYPRGLKHGKTWRGGRGGKGRRSNRNKGKWSLWGENIYTADKETRLSSVWHNWKKNIWFITRQEKEVYLWSPQEWDYSSCLVQFEFYFEILFQQH